MLASATLVSITCAAGALQGSGATGAQAAGVEPVVKRADPADCVVTTYGLEHGLPTLSLAAVAEGPDGRLWVSMTNGTFTFDGRWFRPVKPVGRGPRKGEDAGQGPAGAQVAAIPAATIRLLQDRRGAMWGGVETGGLWCIEEGQMRDVATDGALAVTRFLVEGSDGAIWAGGRGLVRVQGSSVEVLIDAREQPGMSVTSVLEIPRTSGSSDPLVVEIGTTNGLFHWSLRDGLQQVDSLPTIAILRDGSGRRWRFNAEGTTISGWEGVLSRQGDSTGLLSSVVIDQDRTLVALNAEAFVADYNDGEPRLEPYGEPYNISALTPGPGNSVWVATRNEGLRLLRARHFHKIEVPAPGRTMYVVKPGGNDDVFLGSWVVPRLWRWRGGFMPDEQALEVVCDWSGAHTQSVPLSGVFDVLSGDGRSGTLQTRAGLLSFEGESTEVLMDEDWRPWGQLVQVDSGATWALVGQKILEVIDDRPSGRLFHLGRVPVSDLIADGENFIAFEQGRVVGFDTQLLTRRVELEIGSEVFGGLYLHPDGALWVMTDGAGLYRRTAAGEWDHWTTDHGLPTNALGWAGVVPGPTESTHLWVNSNAGVFALSLESLDATAGGQREFLDCAILGSPESLAGDGVACANGMIVLPTFEGPIVVDTHRPLPTVAPPVLSLGDVLVRGRALEADSRFYGATDVVFEYGAAQFPFQYASEVQYRLDGHDDEWLVGNDDRRVRYTSLAPGSYQLQLRSRAPGTGYGPVLTGPVLKILPHWYNRASVRLALGALVAALFVGSFRLRTKILRDRGRVLEGLLDRVSLSEDRYRRLFQTTPTSIVMWSKEGLLLEFNEAGSRLFGFDHRAGVSLSKMGKGEPGQQKLRMAVHHALGGEEPDPIQLATLVAGGAVHSCCWYVVPLVREGSGVWGLMTLVVDQEDEVRAAEAVRRLRRQLARAEEAERAKLARELHDDFSQRLAAVSLELRMTEMEACECLDSKQREALEGSIERIEGLSRDVHALSRQLHPAVLDDLGLVAALRSECARRAAQGATEIEFEVDGSLRNVSDEAQLALFRVAQEAIQNAIKHSKSSRISVEVKETVSGAELVVQDNGRGFEPVKEQRSGIGLSSMRERMNLVEGTFTIESEPGQGSTVRAIA